MALSGNLKTMSFPDLLQFIDSNQQTGTLQIRRHQILKMIYFEKGKIISTYSSDPKEYLGHFLVSRRLINEEELRMAMEIQRNSKMLLGKVLVMGGKVKEEQMAALLRLKAEETVFSIFLWDEGDFQFYENEFTGSLYIRIILEPQSLIFEGVLRRDEWQRIRQVFPHTNLVLEQIPEMMPDAGSSNQKVLSVYNLVDGRRTIENIMLDLHSVEFFVCKILFDLYEQGLVRVKNVLAAPVESLGLGGNFTQEQLLQLGKEHLKKNRFQDALNLLRQISPTSDNYQKDVSPFLAEAEKKAISELYSKGLGSQRVLRLLIPLAQVAGQGLTPEEGFVLSRIDGSWDINSIVSITPMKEFDVLRLLQKLLDRGIIG